MWRQGLMGNLRTVFCFCCKAQIAPHLKSLFFFFFFLKQKFIEDYFTSTQGGPKMLRISWNEGLGYEA